MKRTTSIVGRELIKSFEGFSQTAYICPAGVLSIGYGHTSGVRAGDTVTQEEADILLQQDLKAAENTVNAQGLNVTQLQFDALVSLVYNIGSGSFASSTLLKLLKKDVTPRAEVEKWWKAWNKSNGQTLKGLVRRRAAEYTLYDKGFFLIAAPVLLLVAAVIFIIIIRKTKS